MRGHWASHPVSACGSCPNRCIWMWKKMRAVLWRRRGIPFAVSLSRSWRLRKRCILTTWYLRYGMQGLKPLAEQPKRRSAAFILSTLFRWLMPARNGSLVVPRNFWTFAVVAQMSSLASCICWAKVTSNARRTTHISWSTTRQSPPHLTEVKPSSFFKTLNAKKQR